MIKFIFVLLFLLQASFSYSGKEVFEVDEVQEVLDEAEKFSSSQAETSTDLLKELKRLGHDKLDLSALKDPRVKDLVGKLYDQSNVSLMSLKDKRKIYEEQFKDSAVKIYLDKAPKVRDLLIDVSTDKNTILGFMAIFQSQDRIYILYLVFGSFILNFVLRKLIIGPDSNFLFKFFQRITINVFCSGLMLCSFYFLFEKELRPFLKVVRSHF